MENLIVRVVTEKDMLTVYEQICELENFRFKINDFQNIFLKNINDLNKLYYLAESQDGEIIGYISCHVELLLHHCGKVAEIQELFVKQGFRNLGVGKKLVAHIELLIKKMGCISFEVTAQNKRMNTHAFYKNVGFTSSHLKFTKII